MTTGTPKIGGLRVNNQYLCQVNPFRTKVFGGDVNPAHTRFLIFIAMRGASDTGTGARKERMLDINPV